LNQTDYKTFRAMLSRILPNVVTWLDNIGEGQRNDGTGLPTIHSEWMGILGDCTTDECGLILRKLAAQELPFPQWQELPGFIRREVTNRRPKPKNEYLADVGQKFVISGDLGQAYKEIRDCRGDLEKIEAVKQKWFAKWDQEKHNEPRYRCKDCLDCGMVLCWHIRCLREHEAGKPVNPRTMSVKCSCNASAKWGDGKDCKEKPPQYSRRGFCRWITGALHEIDDWFEWRKTQGIKSHPNYNSDLAIIGGEF
jgi:hypothetical protein